MKTPYTVTAEEFSSRQLGVSRGGSPLALSDIDSPGGRHDAILCIRLFGWGALRLSESPYDGKVRAEYANPDWQYSDDYRAYVASTRDTVEPAHAAD